MLTKISSALRATKPLDRESACGYLTTNLLVLPGLGTLLAGQRSGFFQAGIALTGLALSTFGVFSFAWFCYRARRFPWGADLEFLMGGLPDLLIGAVGVAIFLIGWTWALIRFS